MERVYWIDYSGVRILFSDYSNLSADALVDFSKSIDIEVYPRCAQELEKGTLLSLVNVTNCVATNATVNALKESVELWHPLYKKQAVYGLTPFQHIFLNAVNSCVGTDIRSFHSRESALQWLVDGLVDD